MIADLASVVSGALTSVLGFAFLLWHQLSAQAAPDVVRGRVTGAYGPCLAVLGGLSLLMGAGCFVGILVERGSDWLTLETAGGLLFAAGFVIMGRLALREGRREVILDEVGMHELLHGRPGRSLRWQDVVAVEHWGMSESIAVRSSTGVVIRFGTKMRGQDELWRLLERHVEQERWAACSRALRGKPYTRRAPTRTGEQ
jgi:hypothetical protein